MDALIGVEKGLKTAVETAHDPAAAVPEAMDAEQLALLPLQNAQDGKVARERAITAVRGRGRPPGAQNKSTQAWTNYLLARYPSPLVGLAEIAYRPLEDLATELLRLSGAGEGTKVTYERAVELLKIQLGAMKELAPYLHKKQPIDLHGGEHGLINLFIGGAVVGQVSTQEATNLDLQTLEFETEQNQGVSALDDEKSNGALSNGLDQAIDLECENLSKTSD